MLTVAPSAADAIALLVSSHGLPPTSGMRLAPAASADSQTLELEITLTESPAPDDQVIDQGDAHVFVDRHIVDALNDRILEANPSQNRIEFALAGPPV